MADALSTKSPPQAISSFDTMMRKHPVYPYQNTPKEWFPGQGGEASIYQGAVSGLDPIGAVHGLESRGVKALSGMPMKPWKSNAYTQAGKVEEVPIAWLKKFREYKPEKLRHPPWTSRYEKLKQSIQEEGLKEPLMMTIGKGEGRALLDEGNHRLAILEELGYTHAPVRVNRLQKVGKRGVKVDMIPKPDEYFPADSAPSKVFPELTTSESESFFAKIGNIKGMAKNFKRVEVIKNPTYSDLQGLFREFRKDNPNAARGVPKTRFTFDNKGNEYRWRSDQGAHGQIEPQINRKFNTNTNQNKFMLE